MPQNTHHKVSHSSCVKKLLRIWVRGHFVTSVTKYKLYHESHSILFYGTQVFCLKSTISFFLSFLNVNWQVHIKHGSSFKWKSRCKVERDGQKWTDREVSVMVVRKTTPGKNVETGYFNPVSLSL